MMEQTTLNKNTGRTVDRCSAERKRDKSISYAEPVCEGQPEGCQRASAASTERILCDGISGTATQDIERAYEDLLPKHEALMEWLRKTDFFEAPSSSRFHDSEPMGLARHSLKVLYNTVKLAPSLLGLTYEQALKDEDLVLACLSHDFCKIGYYVKDYKNVKNDVGVWEKVPCYRYRDDHILFGHGADSLKKLNKLYELSEAWELAVRFHMGAFEHDDRNYYATAARKYPEVLCLHTADMMAVSGYVRYVAKDIMELA